jgi:hypothetical protein
MFKRITSPLVFLVCLILLITGPALADRAERSADRTKAGTRVVSSDVETPSAEFSDLVRRVASQVRSVSTSSADKAAGLLSRAARQEGNEAVSTLMQVLDLDLESSVENEKLLSEVYSRLGDLYEGAAAKQVHWYGLAMQYTPDPGVRARLEGKISELGGDPYAWTSVASNSSSPSNREVGYDSCDNAVPITPDFSTTMSIIAPGDHDWFRFDILSGGSNHEIGTISDDIYLDDTDLTLWRGCSEGIGQEMWYYDDDGGEGYMSLIETGCLPEGTYYIEVGGWYDMATPDDFTLYVTFTGTCDVVGPDAYEPDDTPEQAYEIGLPSSTPLHANSWGRARKEIQDRTIYPAGDVDYVTFGITGSELVRIATAIQFPTFFNDFTSYPAYYNPDTVIELWYGETLNYGGLCNSPGTGFSDVCYTDEDCEGLMVDPIPSLPDCIPLWYFPTFAPINWDVPLAYNDDRNPGGGDLGSELLVCLPRADQNTPSASAVGDWLVRIEAYNETDTFDYQLMVKNEVECNFEIEPNNSFENANRLFADRSTEIHGFYDFSAHFLQQDADLFYFDVEEPTALHFETDGYDSFEVDTALELYIGSREADSYFFTGFSNDDCYNWLSCLDVVLPPADELLPFRDASYYINVTSWWLNTNYPYTLHLSVVEAPKVEAEPNDTCETANPMGSADSATGSFDPSCDFDTWSLTLDEASYIVLETDGAGDTSMMLLDGEQRYHACDDDGGNAMGSRIEGCLAPGEYFVRLRPYGYWMNFDYELSYRATPGCLPTDPPVMNHDGLFRCDGAGYASPEEEFNTCPN